MPSSRQTERVVRFGIYEFRPDTHELRKDGLRIRVQTKPLQILRLLIDSPGRLITREELQKTLWPEGTFVDFEGGLNTATNRLRAALNDSAEQPRYIETLPRLGYRFICPVQDNGQESDEIERTGVFVPEEIGTPQTEAPRVELLAKPSFVAPAKGHEPDMRLPVTILVLVAVVSGLALYSHFGGTQRGPSLAFHPLTYREGGVYSARFAAGAGKALYTESEEPQGERTLLLRLDGANAPTEVSQGTVLAVSSNGDLLMRSTGSGETPSTVIAVSANGKPLNVKLGDAVNGDWLPGGQQLAVIRREGVDEIVEFPAGHAVYRSNGWITDLRVSPDGALAAFFEHPVRDDDRGHAEVVDRKGAAEQLGGDWSSAGGLAWSKTSRDVYFTASKTGIVRSLYAVSVAGALRRLSNEPTSLRLFDVARDGRLLIAVDEVRTAMLAQFAGDAQPADVSKFDAPSVQAISKDGQRILFTESGDAGGRHYKTLLLERGKGTSHLIGIGRATALSPDGRFALLIDPDDNSAVTLATVDGSSTKRISGGGLRYQWARFLNANQILAGASYPNRPLMLYRQSLSGGAPELLEGLPFVDYPVIAPGGCRIIGRTAKQILLIDICERTTKSVPAPRYTVPAAWSADGRSVIVAIVADAHSCLARLDVATDALTPWKKLYFPQPAALTHLTSIVAAPDADTYAYSVEQLFSRLYVVDGVS